jgi:hypothetical protein
MQQLPMGLSPGEYWIVLALAVAGTVAGYYFGWRNWRRARLIEDAPTAKIRSAHQGFLELEGQGRLMDGEPIIAPLTSHPCLWYRYQIERQDTYHTKNGTQTKWVTIKQKTSDELFHLDDDTGLCVIDPEGAEITADEKLVWYGDSQWPTSAPLLGSGSKLIGMGRYRYSEWLILAGQPLYVIGQFKTISPGQFYSVAENARDLIRDWKQDQANLLERFDVNKDGKIDQDEWKIVQHTAKLQAQQEHRERAKQPDIHMMIRPEDGQHPYLLSVYPQDQLTRRYRLHAYLFLAGFFIAGAISAWFLKFQFV